MTAEMFGGLVRTLLATLAGVLVAQGYVDNTTAQTIVGATGTIAVALWSMYAKRPK